MNYKQLLETKTAIDLLIKGIDPQSKQYVGDDSILSSQYNQNILSNVSSMIDNMIKYGCNPEKSDKRLKYNFFIPESEREKITISDTPISISAFTYKINDLIDNDVMKKLKATTITTWLCDNGFLIQHETEDGFPYKESTEKGYRIGINSVEKTGQSGNKYVVNLYNANAQRFIVENLSSIIENSIPSIPF